MFLQPTAATQDDLVAEIYETLFGTGDWTRFLLRLATILPDGRAMMVHHDAVARRGALHLAVNVSDTWREAYDTHYSRINPWMPYAARRAVGVASNTSAMLAPRILGRSAFYGDLLQQIDFQEGVGITLERENGLTFALSLLGSDGSERAVSEAKAVLEAIAPHLRRAFVFYRKVTSQTPGAGLDALDDHLTVGVLRVGLRGLVQRANAASERILADRQGLFLDAMGRLVSDDPVVNEGLQAAWSSWTMAAPTPRTASWLVRRGVERLPIRVSLVQPAREAGHAFFVGPEIFVLIEDPEQQADFPAELTSFYGLTAAEGRIFAELAKGRSVAEVALARGLSVETVRTHVKRVIAKTGSRSQADLVRIAARLGSIAPR